MQKKLKNILITIAVTIGILTMLEVVSRIILSRIYNRQFDSSLIEPHKYGPTSGLRANASGTVWGKPFHTDDMGGRKVTQSKKGKPKMLFIGDSVTEGVGVDDQSTFVDRLNSYYDSFDVRNISMIGWSVSDYHNVIDTILNKDSDVKCVFIMYCLNDIYGKSAVKDLPPMAKKGLASTINGFLQNRYATYKLIKLFTYQSSSYYYQYDKAMYEDTVKVEAVISDLIHIKDVCDERHVSFGVFVLPYSSQLSNKSDNLPQQILSYRFEENKLPFFDLLHRWPVPQDGTYSDQFLFSDEIHLSSKGHNELSKALRIYPK